MASPRLGFLRRRGKALGFATDDWRDIWPGVAALATAVIGYAGYLLLVATIPSNAVGVFRVLPQFDPVFWDLEYWRSDAVLAGENLAIFSGFAIMASVGALVAVFYILWRFYSLWFALLVLIFSVSFGVVFGPASAHAGIIRDFLVDDLMRAAIAAGHMPPNALAALDDQIDLFARFGFSAGVATLLAGAVFAIPGAAADRSDPHYLRSRWEAMLVIYVLAMLIVALMALATRMIMDYAAAPLLTRAPEAAAPAARAAAAVLSDEGAAKRLGAAIASYAGITTGLLLLLACTPSFVSIRHAIVAAAYGQAENTRKTNSEARSTNPNAPQEAIIEPDEWIRKHHLGMDWMRTVATTLATAAPALLPALGSLSWLRLP